MINSELKVQNFKLAVHCNVKIFGLLTSQPHPEPCTAIVAVLNLSLKFSKEPKSFLIASIRAPVLDQDLYLNFRAVNKTELSLLYSETLVNIRDSSKISQK